MSLYVEQEGFVTFSFPVERKIDVLPPSSWRQAIVHRTIAFKSSNPTLLIKNKTQPFGWVLFFMAEQEGFELELWLTIIWIYQPLLTIFTGIPNILIPYSTIINHYLVPP